MSKVPTSDTQPNTAPDLKSSDISNTGNPKDMGPESFTLSALWSASLPLNESSPTRWLSKFLLFSMASRVVEVRGTQNIAPAMDPFILALNHSQKLEALYIPAMLHFLRQGRLVHFLADWNFCLIPGIWLFYHYGGVIMVARKPAKPRFLNVFKPLFIRKKRSYDQAVQALNAKQSIGIFPEGTTNRNPCHLLKGYSGAAQLSLQTGVPVVPAGVRFPFHDGHSQIPEAIPFILEFGSAMYPQACAGKPPLAHIRQWHLEIMSAIARLSGKSWNPQSRKA
ncbi:MAG: lysophospholipid acyltransferase family protein [Verrucomicrobiota bacterium]|nr:lysophospholipid acyltransferase family protein [Verrucomicrobiota bacterium]